MNQPRLGLAAGAVPFGQVRAGEQPVDGRAVRGAGEAEVAVNGGQRLQVHQALADALLVGDHHQPIALARKRPQHVQGAVGEPELTPMQNVAAGGRRNVDHAVAVQKGDFPRLLGLDCRRRLNAKVAEAARIRHAYNIYYVKLVELRAYRQRERRGGKELRPAPFATEPHRCATGRQRSRACDGRPWTPAPRSGRGAPAAAQPGR